MHESDYLSCLRPIEERYKTIQDTVNSRAVLSIGVACCQWRDEKKSTPTIPTVQSPDNELPSTLHGGQSPFPTSHPETISSSASPITTDNPAVTGQAGTDRVAPPSPVSVGVQVFNVWLMCQRPYTIDPSSAAFLLQHGFDFNKQFAKGIPYAPGQLEVSTCMTGGPIPRPSSACELMPHSQVKSISSIVNTHVRESLGREYMTVQANWK